jgi:hypothetical protein
MELPDQPVGGKWKMWLLGVVLPAALAFQGIRVCIIRHVPIIESRSKSSAWKIVQLDMDTTTAIVAGTFFIVLGTAVHFHYFWGLFQESQVVSQIGKLVCAVILVIDICIFIGRMFP